MKKRQGPLKESVHIGDVLKDVLKTFRATPDEDALQVWDIWSLIVGDDVAENAQPAAVKGHLLLVHVTSSVWIHHLQFRKHEMIDSINRALGQRVVDDIKFKVGPFPK